MTRTAALILAAILAAAPALADTADAPLAPGKPAGVQQAQVYGSTLLYAGLGAAFIAGLVILADDQKNTTTTTGTNP